MPRRQYFSFTKRQLFWPMTCFGIALGSFAAGLLGAGGVWLKTGYQWLPSEIVLRPPPPNATWYFPDYSFAGAEKLQSELARRLAQQPAPAYTAALIDSSILTCVMRSDSLYRYRVLQFTPHSYGILSLGDGTFEIGNRHTLLTEQGIFQLHPVPKRRSADYNELLHQRFDL